MKSHEKFYQCDLPTSIHIDVIEYTEQICDVPIAEKDFIEYRDIFLGMGINLYHTIPHLD